MREEQGRGTGQTRGKSIPGAASHSRRQALRVAAAMGVGGLVLPGSAVKGRSASRTPGVVVGAHPWVYAAPRPGNDITPILDQIFADMTYAGMGGVELMHTAFYPDDAVTRIKRLVEKHGLPVIGSSYGASMWDVARKQEVLDDARKVIERVAEVGGKTLGTSVGATPKPKTAEQLDTQAEVLRELIRFGAEHGVVLNLHNHTYEVANNQHDLKGTLERITDVKLGPDLNWLKRGGVDPVEFLREHGKQVAFLHLRDQNDDGKWSEALGEGSMDYKAIAQALHEIPFQGHAVIELAHERDFAPTRPLRESLRMSREFVRETLGY